MIMADIPNYVDCVKCCNENSVLCMTCRAKYATAPYLNFAPKMMYATHTTTGINKKQPNEAMNCAECFQFVNDSGNINACKTTGVNNLIPELKNCGEGACKYNLNEKEAVDILKNHYLPENHTILREAVDMAIRALENAGCGCSICLTHNNMKCPKMKGK